MDREAESVSGAWTGFIEIYRTLATCRSYRLLMPRESVSLSLSLCVKKDQVDRCMGRALRSIGGGTFLHHHWCTFPGLSSYTELCECRGIIGSESDNS